jgi:hypothetical protein
MRKSILTLALGGVLAVGLSTAAMAQTYTYTYSGSYPVQTYWPNSYSYYGYPGYYSNPVAGAANFAGDVVGGALNAAGSIVGGTLNAAGNVARDVTTPYPYYGSSYPNYTYRTYSYRGQYPSYTYWGSP